MSDSDIAPFVAAALRDKVVLEQGEEIKSLRSDLLEERQSRRKVEIVARDGTVFATGSLEGVEPEVGEDCPVPGLMRVKVTMVDDARTCKKSDLSALTIRIGGIDAYSIDQHSAGAVSFRAFDFLLPEGEPYYHLFLGWPTKLTLGLMLGIVPDPCLFPINLDGHNMELDGISFKCGPKLPGRDAVDDRSDLVLGEEEVDEVIFKVVMFSAFVGENTMTMNVFGAVARHTLQALPE